MTVGVVTPTFNGADHVADTIASVQRQSEPPVIHVIVDDGSVDDTSAVVAALAERDPRLRLVRQPNAGLSAARNRGLAELPAEVDRVLFLDDDDLLRPGALGLLGRALDASPSAPAAHGAVAAVDGRGDPVPLVRREASARRTVIDPGRLWTPRRAVRTLGDDEPSDLASLAYVLYIYSVGQVLVRRSAIEAAGGFDTSFVVAQDLDLWLRLASRGSLAFEPSIVLDYRQAGPSLSSDQSRTRREDLVVRATLIADRSLPPEVRRLARDVHRHHEWHRAADRLDIARTALRRGDVGLVARELARTARTVGEAGATLLPGTRFERRRVARFKATAARR